RLRVIGGVRPQRRATCSYQCDCGSIFLFLLSSIVWASFAESILSIFILLL
ncbi:hypothetical protein QBC36DRAFT_215747, partial [Triangularia setosa]